MALVKFIACDAAAYAGASKDNDTLYFVSDEQRLYKGAVAYSGGIFEAVSEFPESGNRNTLYINSKTGEVKYWNGATYTQVVKPFAAAITPADNGSLPTSKAVADYVAAEIAKIDAGTLAADIAALKKKDAEHDTAISTTLPAAIADAKKAGTDAATAVTALESGKVATNTAEITKLKSGKADKATTLAGYGIGDAYTKAQTDSAISAAIAKAPHLKREIVTQLPEVGAADTNTIYMVGTGEGSETSVYKEYMLINGKFELLGDSKVDLTNYATKEEVKTAKQEAIGAASADATSKANKAKTEAIAAAAADADTKAEKAKNDAIAAADGKIAAAIGALDVTDAAVGGQYVSSVSEKDGKITVTRAALPAAATLVEGTENGTVKFNGEDVKVHGLGDAAFKASTAFDAAGAATTAETNAKEYANSLASNYATANQGSKADQVFAALTWGTL